MNFLEVCGVIFLILVFGSAFLIIIGAFIKIGIDYRYEILSLLRIIELDVNYKDFLFRWRFRWSKNWHGRLK